VRSELDRPRRVWPTGGGVFGAQLRNHAMSWNQGSTRQQTGRENGEGNDNAAGVSKRLPS